MTDSNAFAKLQEPHEKKQCEHVGKIDYFCVEDYKYLCESCLNKKHTLHSTFKLGGRAKLVVKALEAQINKVNSTNRGFNIMTVNVEKQLCLEIGRYLTQMEEEFNRRTNELKHDLFTLIKNVSRKAHNDTDPIKLHFQLNKRQGELKSYLKNEQYFKVCKLADEILKVDITKLTQLESTIQNQDALYNFNLNFEIKCNETIKSGIAETSRFIKDSLIKLGQRVASQNPTELQAKSVPYSSCIYVIQDNNFILKVDLNNALTECPKTLIKTQFKNLNNSVIYLTPDDKKLYLAGGVNNGAEVYEYNEVRAEFELKGNLTQIRKYGHAFLSLNSHNLVIIGGVNERNHAINDCEYYNIPTCRCIKMASLNKPRCYPSAFNFWGKALYVVGGSYNSTFYHNSIEKLDSLSSNFVILKLQGTEYLTPCNALGAFVLNRRKVLLFGGNSQMKLLPQSVIFNVDKMTLEPEGEKGVDCRFKHNNQGFHEGAYYHATIEKDLVIYKGMKAREANESVWEVKSKFLNIA